MNSLIIVSIGVVMILLSDFIQSNTARKTPLNRIISYIGGIVWLGGIAWSLFDTSLLNTLFIIIGSLVVGAILGALLKTGSK